MNLAFLSLIILINIILILLLSIALIQLAWFLQRRWVTMGVKRVGVILGRSIVMQKVLSPSVIPLPLRTYNILIEIVEEMDRRFSDKCWQDTKRALLNKYLKPRAKKWCHSRFWSRRYRAARIYHLDTIPEEAPEAILLLKDKNFYIRMLAVKCLVALATREAVFQLMRQMSFEHHYSRYAYHDAIRQLPEYMMTFIVEIFREAKDIPMQVACIDALSSRPSIEAIPFIVSAADTTYPEIRLAIAQFAEQQLEPLLVPALQGYLNDNNDDIRTLAAKALGELKAESAIPRLEELLQDPVWEVRLQASLTLKRLGSKGREVLERQDWDLNPIAYEIARYTLTLP